MKAIKGLLVVTAILMLLQSSAIALQPDRWSSPAPRSDTRDLSDARHTDLHNGWVNFLDLALSPFMWLKGMFEGK